MIAAVLLTLPLPPPLLPPLLVSLLLVAEAVSEGSTAMCFASTVLLLVVELHCAGRAASHAWAQQDGPNKRAGPKQPVSNLSSCRVRLLPNCLTCSWVPLQELPWPLQELPALQLHRLLHRHPPQAGGHPQGLRRRSPAGWDLQPLHRRLPVGWHSQPHLLSAG